MTTQPVQHTFAVTSTVYFPATDPNVDPVVVIIGTVDGSVPITINLPKSQYDAAFASGGDAALQALIAPLLWKQYLIVTPPPPPQAPANQVTGTFTYSL